MSYVRICDRSRVWSGRIYSVEEAHVLASQGDDPGRDTAVRAQAHRDGGLFRNMCVRFSRSDSARWNRNGTGNCRVCSCVICKAVDQRPTSSQRRLDYVYG